MSILSLVEKGWAGARQLTIPVCQQGTAVRHVIRGVVSQEVIQVLTPYPGMQICGIPRLWYRVTVWAMLVWGSCRPMTAVLVDNPKTADWVARWFPWVGSRLYTVEESSDGGVRLWHCDQPIEPQAFFATVCP